MRCSQTVKHVIAIALLLFLNASLLFAQDVLEQARIADSITAAQFQQHTPRFSNIGRRTLQEPSLHSQLQTLLPQVTRNTRKRYTTGSAAALASTPTVCYDTSGRYFIQQDTTSYHVYTAIKLRDGNMLLAGERSSYLNGFQTMGFLMKCSDSGTVNWTKHYDSAGRRSNSYMYYYRAVELNDGSIMLAGVSQNPVTQNNEQLLTRVDNAGNIIWSKVYKSRLWKFGSGSADYFGITGLKQDPVSHDIFFNSAHWMEGYNITRIRVNDGSVVWSNYYQLYGTTHFDRPFGLEFDNDEIVSFSKFIGYSGTNVSIYRINKNTGDTISKKYFAPIDPSHLNLSFLNPDHVTKLDNGNFAISGTLNHFYRFPNDNGADLFHAAVAEFDRNSNFVQAYCFRNPHESNHHNTRITVFKDGSGVFSMAKVYGGFTADVFYVQFNNGQVINQRRRYYSNEGMPTENDAVRLDDGSDVIIKFLGDGVTGINKVEFLNLNASDTGSSCLGFADFSTYTERYSFEEITWGLDSIGYNDLRETTNKTLTATNGAPYWMPACRQISYCDTLSIAADRDTICFGTTVSVTARKNAACGARPLFTFDVRKAQLQKQLNDSVYEFRILKPGTTIIYASIMGCSVMTDSVKITVLNTGGPVNLGNDTVICEGNTLSLNARRGYKSYLWQDGTSDSVIAVSAPGKYFVTVQDSCGNVFSDTLIVHPHPPISFSIGSDFAICKNDTGYLYAPGNFINYNWGPAYNLRNMTERDVKVFPKQDTSYYLRAEKTPGCFVYDTIKVTVHPAADIDLGPDTSFCAGNTVVIDAGGGFRQYYWSTGEYSREIRVHQKGMYRVTALNSNGCRSIDEIQILNVWPAPDLSLGKDAVICEGSSKLLDAGFYSSYLWNTGSTRRTISVAEPGVYGVRVMDIHGCTGSDSMLITGIVPPPSGFLPADTAICNYGSLQLSPKAHYVSYLWNDNSVMSSINIKKAGLYRLTVTDANGCIGTDTINITVNECLQGFFVPNAFTPGNNKTTNNRFKPLIFGNLVDYEFMIYNRWGQVVFKTSDINNGWDGTFNGQPQATDTYVWYCKYQLAGESAKLERGQVLLIR